MATIPLHNEKQLLLQLQQSNELAFEEIYIHYIDTLYRKLLYLVKFDYIAEELAQDVFSKIWEKRKTIDPDLSFHGFINRIAQNLVSDFYRRLALDRKLQDHLINTTTELYYSLIIDNEDPEKMKMLSAALASLPEQRRKVMILVKLEGLSYQEVSKALGISTSTIRDHVVKGTKSLKKYIAEKDLLVILILVTHLFNMLKQKNI